MTARPRDRRTRSLTAEPIRTGRLRLDPLRVDDAAEMARALDDPALYRYLGKRPPDERRLRTRYADLLEGSDEPGVSWCTWTVRTTDGHAVGMAQAVVGPDVGGPRAVISWMVGSSWQRRGYATEASRAVMGWLRGHGVATITAHIDPRNEASAAVARSLGLVPTSADHHGEQVWTDRPHRG